MLRSNERCDHLNPPGLFEPEKLVEAVGRPWQPLFERSELVGCHSPAAVSSPARNAAESFFFANFLFCGKKESGRVPKKRK
jgi:hypothetical protein